MAAKTEPQNEYLSSGEWMRDKALSHIPHSKLEFLQIMLFESRKLKQEEMLPFFMSVIKVSREKNITFTEKEMDAILEVLKEHSSADELTRMNQIMQMRKSMG
ncbi:MAG: hypothetical protein HFI10_03130 [Lachnospiraceae bacterium]|jgi:hypothetical protein|nr:hypothetical protein [Lachnospiraceae bacterium]